MPRDKPLSPNEESLVVEELSADTKETLLSLGLEIGQNGYVIWSKDNQDHPRNWTGTRKAYDISLIVIFDLVAYGFPYNEPIEVRLTSPPGLL